MQKALSVTKNFGRNLTFAKINKWAVLNLFKAYLIGTFGYWDKRFSHTEHPKYGIVLKFHNNRSTPVKVKDRKVDITRPFHNMKKKDSENVYEVYMWNNQNGFTKLQAADSVAPSILASGLNPEYIVVLNYGYNHEISWCNLSCTPWIEQSKLIMDWHDKLGQLVNKNHYA